MPGTVVQSTQNPNSPLAVDPPALLRRVSSSVLSRMIDPKVIQKRRTRVERVRKRRKLPHVIEYFHQLDDPYSHLAAQLVRSFVTKYDISLLVHLIRAAGGKDQPEMEKLAHWARRDASLIAPYYGLRFPKQSRIQPDESHQRKAALVLSRVDVSRRLELIADVSTAVWDGDDETLDAFVSDSDSNTRADADAFIEAGSRRIQQLQHYSGGTFYYGGEWYWGVDRLYHLEQRLRELGACKDEGDTYLAIRPNDDLQDIDAREFVLDFYCSLNSPYTAIAFDRTMALTAACGCQLKLKPVLPMIMRGVPATRRKAVYIFKDAQREAEIAGIPFGPAMLPIGKPTINAYSMLPWAKEQGKEEALFGSLLKHAFTGATALHTSKGMRQAVEAAGLEWRVAKQHIGRTDWQVVVDVNQSELNDDLGLWGVPSYKLRGTDGEEDLVVWGQDRLWLVEAELRRRASTT